MTETIQSTSATAVPMWLVSTRHGTIVFSEGVRPGDWRPFGVHHARQVGALQTACGIPAAEWEIFWDMPFPRVGDAMCRDCRIVIDRVEASLAKLPPAALGRAS